MTPLTITVVLRPVRARCSPHRTTFQLLVAPASPYLQAVQLNDLSRLEVRVGAKHAETSIDEGGLALEDSEVSLREATPVRVSLEGAASHLVDLSLDEASATGKASFSFAGKAAGISVDDQQKIPSYLEQNSDLVYLVLGVILGLLVAAIVDYVVVLYRR